jgi:hypothetical protein
MWAQMISVSLTPGREDQLERISQMINDAEPPDSGLLHQLALRDQSNPTSAHFLIVCESEEKARAREADPARNEALGPVRELMSEVFDGPPRFTDLDVAALRSY